MSIFGFGGPVTSLGPFGTGLSNFFNIDAGSQSESPSESSSESPSESSSEEPVVDGILLNNVETNASSVHLIDAEIIACVFDSPVLLDLPDPFDSSEYDKNRFIYDNYDFSVLGNGEDFWEAHDIPTGIGGLDRYGIGAFYFYSVPDDDQQKPVVEEDEYEEEVTHGVKFWPYISTFCDFFSDNTRLIFENIWDGMVIAGESLKKKANRFYDAIHPENSRKDVLEDYYDIQIGPSYSRPLNLDPTTVGGNFNIAPKGKVLINPEYAGAERVFRDMIEITAADYYKIRMVGLGCYVMVQSKNENIEDKVFKINNLLSSEEPIDTLTYAEINESLNQQRVLVDSGTTDDVEANKLKDSAKLFTLTIHEGDVVENTTNLTTANVVKVSDYELLLDDDIMGNLENYEIYSMHTNDIGIIGIQAIDDTDISEFKVDIRDNGTDDTELVWEVDSLIINLKTSGASLDNIAEIINPPGGSTGTPWATLIDKGGTRRFAPIFGTDAPGEALSGQAIEIDDLPNFRYGETANGRYIPPSGQVWSWYLDRPLNDGTDVVGDVSQGEYVPDKSKMRYMIVVEGDLSYLGSDGFSIYLTTARSYNIEKFVISIPMLQTFITLGKDPEYQFDLDYTIHNFILEFRNDIYGLGSVKDGDYLYYPKVPVIEHYLFDLYGNMIGIPDWTKYNFDNISGKAAINATMKALQNISKEEEYNRALNVYYGVPVSPCKSKVIGLYESYGYKIASINEVEIYLELRTDPTEEELSLLVQKGGRFLVEGKGEFTITHIHDRALGYISLSETTGLEVGDRMHIKLRNRYQIKSIFKEGSVEAAPAIDVYSYEGSGTISHLVDVINTISKNLVYPEMVLYGTKDIVGNEGIYHITAATESPGLTTPREQVRLSLYHKGENEDPLYNDYIDSDHEDIEEGFVHIPWPTHKFLYLLVNGEYYYKAYLDAPVDTIFDTGDDLEKYQVIGRSVSALNKKSFPDWNQFDMFRRFSGLNYQSDTLELIKTIPGSKFGDYFPTRYKEIG